MSAKLFKITFLKIALVGKHKKMHMVVFKNLCILKCTKQTESKCKVKINLHICVEMQVSTVLQVMSNTKSVRMDFFYVSFGFLSQKLNYQFLVYIFS